MRISAESEGAPEDEIEDRHHDGETEPGVGKHLIDTLQARLMLIILRMRECLRQNTMHVRTIGIVVPLITKVVDRVRGRGRFMDRILNEIQTVRQTVVLTHRYTTGRHTDQLLQFRNIQRMVGF